MSFLLLKISNGLNSIKRRCLIKRQTAQECPSSEVIISWQNNFTKIEYFMSRTNFLISTTFDDYYNRRLSKNKIISVFIFRFIAFFGAIRFLLYPLFRTPYIRDLTCNATHYMGNPILISFVMFCSCIDMDILVGTSIIYWGGQGSEHTH